MSITTKYSVGTKIWLIDNYGKILPTIYKSTKTGAVVYCSISTDGKTIIVETGQVNTPNPTHHTTTCEPKNIGKANEISAEDQADKEALAKHTKKIKSGYVLDPSGETNVRLPMKVKVYQDQLKNVIFPCYTSPKLNGVNYTVRLDGNTLLATSRGGESYPIYEHQRRILFMLMSHYGLTELNGEQYIHGKHLQDIQAAVTKPNDLTISLVFCIFDLPDLGLSPYTTRLETLAELDKSLKHSVPVQVVPVRTEVQNHETIRTHFLEDITAGYEGTVIRNTSGLYQYNVRSSDVFKYKEAQDAEFKVVSHKFDKHNHPVFQCESSGGLFWVKLKGTAEQRLAMGIVATTYYGEWLKVEFEVLSKAGKPTKPVGICFRNCDTNGNPLE